MYTDESILYLSNRIGWGKPLDSELPTISESNLAGTSGRKVNSFHQLATVENIYAAVSKVDMEEAEFNEYLASVRNQSTIQVLTAILDRNPLYEIDKDYSNIITTKATLFDDAIGYCIAISMLELFISSSRTNLLERNAKLAYQSLKVELEGAKNDSGHTIAKGIISKMNLSIKSAQVVIFPDPIVVKSLNLW